MAIKFQDSLEVKGGSASKIYLEGAGGTGSSTILQAHNPDDGAGHTGGIAYLKSSGWGEAEVRVGGSYMRQSGGRMQFISSGQIAYFDTGNVGVNVYTPSAKMHISGNSTNPNLSNAVPENVSLIVSNSDSAYGTMFATYGSGIGALQQRRTNTNTFYDFLIQPHGGRLGVGVTSPAQTLHVGGTARFDGYTYTNELRAVSDSGNRIALHDGAGNIEFRTQGGTERMTITYGGNVGIGTASPQELLDVRGSLYLSTGSTATTRIIPSANGGNSKLTFKGGNFFHYVTFETSWNDFEYAYLKSSYNGGDSDFFLKKSDSAGATVGNTKISTGTSYFNSALGVGTTSPQRMLDVNVGTDSGVGASIAGRISVGEYQGLHFGYSEAGNNLYRKSAIVFERTDLTANDAQGKIHILNGPQGSSASATLADSKLTIDERGNVGINTTNPQSVLEVNGITRVVGSMMVGNSATSNVPSTTMHIKNSGEAAIRLEDSDSNNLAFDIVVNEGQGFYIEETIGGDSGDDTRLFIQHTTGNVGIGNENPTSLLDVNGTVSITGTNSTGNESVLLQFNAGTDQLGSIRTYNAGAYNQHTRFYTSSVSGAGETLAFMYDQSGNFGIGTTNPTRKLHIDAGSGYAALFDSTNRYKIGFANGGTEEWWIVSNSNGSFAIHENGVGDQLTINSGGNLIANGSITATGGNSNNWNTAYGWGNHASAGYAHSSHKYHSFANGDEYYDSYGQGNYLRMFTETATFDTFRFRAYRDVEISPDGNEWIPMPSLNLDSLLDGREDTGISLTHEFSKFRFTIDRASGWPTTALFVMQSSWTDTNGYACEIILETWDGSAWLLKDQWTYSNFQRGLNLHTTTQTHDGRGTMRVTILMDWNDASHNYHALRRIMFLSNFSGGETLDPWSWNYNKVVNFDALPQAAGANLATQSWVTSQGYITSETDSQTLSWNGGNGQLTISNGNTVDLDGRYLQSLPSHEHSYIRTVLPTQEADDAMPSTGYALQHFLGKGPSNNDGHILGMTWTGTSIYGAQIWVDTDPNNLMAFRSRSNAGVWTRWNNLWHDGNLVNVSQLSNDAGYLTSIPSEYLTQTEGDARYLNTGGDTVTGLFKINNGTSNDAYTIFNQMGGASSVNNPSGTAGAIRIALPVAEFGTNTMMSMTIKVYEYSSRKSFTLFLGGYNYNTHSWYNVFASMIGDDARSNVPVRFGHDGERDVIWLGNPDWSWSYPNVFVTDFQSGHTQRAGWGDGWEISFDTEPAINVSQHIDAHKQITTENIAGQSVSYATSAGSASSATTASTSNTVLSTAASGSVLMKHNNSEANAWIFQEYANNWGVYWFNTGSQAGQSIGNRYTTVGAEMFGFKAGNSQNAIQAPQGWDGVDSNTYYQWMISNYTGSAYFNNDVESRTGFYVNGNKVATESFATGAADAVNTRIDEEVLPAIATKADSSHTHSAADITSGTLDSARLSGTYSINVSGTSSYAENLYRDDNRTISPREDINGTLSFGFTSFQNNSTGPWADYLHLRSYTDSSGGRDNLLMFSKSDMEIRLWQQDFNSAENYADFRDVAFKDEIPTNNNQLTNGAGYLTSFDITSQTDPKYVRSDVDDTKVGDLNVSQGRITIKRGTGLTHTEWEDDSTANGRGQLILDSHYSDLIIASRNANSNKHGSTLTFATQSTSTTDVAKWVIGQGQYQEGADHLAFAYGVNQTNPHSILGTDNANADFVIMNGGKVCIGGTFDKNAYSSTSETRLMFGGANSDAQGNYYIGTNKEDYGGNYTKLDLRWHTGIRMGAQPSYGGIRFFDNEDLNTRIMSIGETDNNIRIDNNLWIGGAGGWITDLLDAKASAGHNHDSQYVSSSGGRITKNAVAQGASDFHLELYSNDINEPESQIGIRFHQGGEYWGQLRYNVNGFRFTTGNTDELVPVHGRFVGDLTGTADSANAVAWANVSGKPTSFTPSAHTHSAEDITSGNLDLSGRIKAVGNSVFATGGTSNGKEIRMYVNDSWAYLTTNVGKYYLNAEVRIDGGKIGSYNEDLSLATSGTTKVVITNDGGHMFPVVDRTQQLGLETNRWQIVFCEILDSAGQHEKNLQNPEGEKDIADYKTGTVLVWKGGKNVPCTKAADHMRMGIAVNGVSSPLIQGAEPVLVTGPVKEGDYLVTSRKEGHAEAISPEFMRQHNLFDCVLGKALEDGEGESHLIKTWINI